MSGGGNSNNYTMASPMTATPPNNGSPYPSNSPAGPPMPHSAVGPGMPPGPPHLAHQYPYSVHGAYNQPSLAHAQYYAHGGPPPQARYHPSAMMVYPPPAVDYGGGQPGGGNPHHPASAAVAAGATGAKRKRDPHRRGSQRTSDEESGSDLAHHPHPPEASAPGAAAAAAAAARQAEKDAKKRTKTQRACDSCRSRKIRCDVLPDTEPPLCRHCKQYGFECTFFLPITETRFKKKRLEEEAAAAAAAETTTAAKHDHNERRASTSGSPRDPGSAGGVGASVRSVFGPTSPNHLLHSQATIPSRVYESWDARYHHKWEVSRDGEGLITVDDAQDGSPEGTTNNGNGTENGVDLHNPTSGAGSGPHHVRALDLRIERSLIQQLVNAYFAELAPLLPVITEAEFVAQNPPPPILLYSICLVTAARREVPQSVFDSLRYAVSVIVRQEDVLSTASVTNVQALLILCMLADAHSAYVPQALSALWIRLGTAIRMAQDLGLHRAESVKQNIELRRRIWSICVISDRWISLAYGHPYMIDVQDCDARLPSSGDASDLYLDHFVKLSLLLGRVLKTIYTPSGLNLATDEMLQTLLKDIEKWKADLPDSLKFRGPDSPRHAGFLHLLYSCALMIFWRVFMRISYSCPAHLKFTLTVSDWSQLVQLTGESIDWLDKNEHTYDVWLLVVYAATSCALVQYHTWARRQDPAAAAKLKKLRDCVRRWESSLSPDHMSARRKTAEIIALLYEATQGPPVPLEAPPLNPTGGVTAKRPLEGLNFVKDPSRPGGGVFVARGSAKGDYTSTPGLEGTVIDGSDDDDDVAPAGVAKVEAVDDDGDGGGGGGGKEGEESKADAGAAPKTANGVSPQSRPASTAARSHPSSYVSSPETTNDGAALAEMQLFQQQQQQHHHHQQQQQQQHQQRMAQLSRSNSVAAAAAAAAASRHATPMVAYAPLGGGGGMDEFGGYGNVNPAMNGLGAPSEVQVLNLLDGPADPSGAMGQFAAMADPFMTGLPTTTTMFDWGQWDSFFQRFPGTDGAQFMGFQPPPSGPMTMQYPSGPGMS